jgi:hypothetical protein
MERGQEVIISVYFGEDSPSEWAELEYQTTFGKAEDIFERLESANPDKLFRLGDNLINLKAVKSIKYEPVEEEVPEEDREYLDEN